MITKHLDELKHQFNECVSLKERRPGLFQVIVPLFHEDGDMIDIFIREGNNGHFSITDCGMTLMRLSYGFDLDTENKRKIFNKLLDENQLKMDDGHIVYDTAPPSLCPAILHFAQSVAKVSNLDILKREIISGLFVEMVNEFVMEELAQFHPSQSVFPLPSRNDLEVDYSFEIKPHPVYLFTIRNNSQARLAAISCLEFQKARLGFKGFVVHDDFNTLTARDRSIITSAADKQFVSLEDFKANAALFLEREVAA